MTSVGKYPYHRSIMEIDGIGLVVMHEKDYAPTEQDLRRHLIGWNEQHEQFIQADSLQEAVREFLSYKECTTGLKYKAWEMINSEHKPILEYSGCSSMRITKGGCVACAYYDEPTEGGHMVCVLDNLDEPPLACPINNQREHKGFREEIVQEGGIWVRRYFPMTKEMDPQINGIRLKPVQQ